MIKLFNLFKRKSKGKFYTFTNPYNNKQITFYDGGIPIDKKYLQFSFYKWQYPFVKSEICRINDALLDNIFTNKLVLDYADFKQGCFVFNPYTPGGKIALNPCNMNTYFRTKEGIPYGLTIRYDIYDNPKTAHYYIAYTYPKGDAYTVDLHYVKDAFHVTKVIRSSNENNNEKLYHIRKEDIE